MPAKKGGPITAYCVGCRGYIPLQTNLYLLKKKLPNGNKASILCGSCRGCVRKACRIVANSKK